MRHPVRFIFALHNHQPVGNFDHVFEQSFQESYLPFLDVFEQYDAVKLTLHTSGSLMEWLDKNHPEYVNRLADLVAQKRMEIIGGPFYEPILAMLPSWDRQGQIRKYSQWLKHRLGAEVRGLWVPERVWEQSFVSDLAEAEMEYTILDDCHFKNAFLDSSMLMRHCVTEDHGRTMNVFPGSERLRYLIPFRPVEELIEYFQQISEQYENAVLTHGDDGEKFGTWPNTFQYVYQEGWLHRFFQTLTDHADWIITTTPSEVIDAFHPTGKVYLSDGSYREMTEWVIPPKDQNELEDLHHTHDQDSRLLQAMKFVRGGNWRNFKVRYPESDEMYARMMNVSQQIQQMLGQGFSQNELDEACEALYRGQCNCSYWHGAFGGIYLPHLRNEVYRQLIKADNLLHRLRHQDRESSLEVEIQDYNCDGRKEIRLANNELIAWITPHQGGTLYELDVRNICHNLGASLTRREEAYHRKILRGQQNAHDACASIHDRVVFKQEGLDRRIQYDPYPRKSLIDLFYGCDVSFEDVRNGTAPIHSTFHQSEYETHLKRIDDSVEITMKAQGMVYGVSVQLEKTLVMSENSPEMEILYRLSNLPEEYRFHFAVEMNFAGLPGKADDRYYANWDGEKLGDLGATLNLKSMDGFTMNDEWLGLKLELEASRSTDFYAFPVETVSQSEGGFELVQQSIAVQPHWMVVPEEDGCWEVKLLLNCDTSMTNQGHEIPAPKMQNLLQHSPVDHIVHDQV